MSVDLSDGKAMTPEQAELFLLELVKVIHNGRGAVTVTVSNHHVLFIESTYTIKLPVPQVT